MRKSENQIERKEKILSTVDSSIAWLLVFLSKSGIFVFNFSFHCLDRKKGMEGIETLGGCPMEGRSKDFDDPVI